MRIITLEEHVSFPEMTVQIPKDALGEYGRSTALQQMISRRADITGERLQSMNDTGITMQVLSVDSFGVNLLTPGKAPAFAMQYNNL